MKEELVKAEIVRNTPPVIQMSEMSDGQYGVIRENNRVVVRHRNRWHIINKYTNIFDDQFRAFDTYDTKAADHYTVEIANPGDAISFIVPGRS